MAMRSPDSGLKEMGGAMHLKFMKYWDEFSIVLDFAIILDPRFKLNYIRFCLNKYDSDFEFKSKEIVNQLRMLFKEYDTTRSSTTAYVFVENTDQQLKDSLKVSLYLLFVHFVAILID